MRSAAPQPDKTPEADRPEEIPEVEILRPMSLSEEESVLLEMHSFLNVMNVLSGELIFLGDYLEEEARLAPALGRVHAIARGLVDRGQAHRYAREVDAEAAFILETIAEARRAAAPARQVRPEVAEIIDNIASLLRVLGVRAREIVARIDGPDAWLPHPIDALREQFTCFFAAVEKNSKGRYRIVYNIAEQEGADYLVDFKIDSIDGDAITMPPVMQDVMRDLIANARKYTAPGGRIYAGLVDDGTALRFVVEDNGRGIPMHQLDDVVGFGVRGDNVASHETRGGGFGLTKAYYVTRRFGGRMWIRSALGRGTRITLRIPRPGTAVSGGAPG